MAEFRRRNSAGCERDYEIDQCAVKSKVANQRSAEKDQRLVVAG